MPGQTELAPEALMTALVAGFDHNPAQSQMGLRELIGCQPAAFLRGALTMFARGGISPPAADAIARLLLANNLLVSTLCDPSLSGHGEALALVRAAAAADPSLDIRIARTLSEDEAARSAHVTLRVLDLLAEISNPSRIMPQLMPLLRDHNDRVRSKAVLMIGRSKQDPRWLDPYLRDPNPRMRSNAVEALWGLASRDVLDIFYKACLDPHHRVAANGCVGLHAAGSSDGVLQMEQLANFQDPLFQAAAAWAMGTTRDPVLLPSLQRMTRSPDGMVRRSAMRGIAAIRKAQAA